MASDLNNLRSGTNIPPEICGIICQDAVLTKHDLCVLCAVSQAFREEARRILYSSVELDDKVQLKSFCLTVIRRPYLVRAMRKLVFIMPSEKYIDPDDFLRIVKMLRLSTSLRDLRVLCDSSSSPGMAIQGWMLEGHVFKLTTFSNSYFSHGRLKKFLESQPEIETIQIVQQQAVGLDGTSMPSLKNLSCPVSVIQELCDRPSSFRIKSGLERLQVTVSMWWNSWAVETFSLRIQAQFGKTLRSLSILKRMDCHWEDWEVEEDVANVAKHLPNVKFLQIMDYTITAVPYPDSFLNSFTIFKLFTQIETLILRPPLLHSDDPIRLPSVSSWSALQTVEGRLSVATRIMEAMPTLKRLVLIGNRSYEYNRLPLPALDLLEVQVRLDEDEWLKVRLL